MKDKIEIGEYIRSISGEIDRVDALYGMIEETVHLEKHKWQSVKNIAKHSKNIIDLIEIGDYVNGELIEESNYDLFINSDIKEEYAKTIETIVTHEQMKEMEYRV